MTPTNQIVMRKLYRARADISYSIPRIEIEEWLIEKDTLKGFWITNGIVTRWMSKTSRNRFARESVDDSILDLKRRMSRRIFIQKSAVQRLELLLHHMNNQSAILFYTTPVDFDELFGNLL